MVQPPAAPELPTAVIDNTLLSRLTDLDIAKFLPLVFQLILIPPEVKREAFRAPHEAGQRLQNLINEMAGFLVDCHEVDPTTRDFLKADLDEGEAAAIAQADAKGAVLLLDERKGVSRAIRMEITVVRTLRLLNLLKESGAIRAVRPYHEKLLKTGFHTTQAVINQLLTEANELSQDD